MLYTAYFIKQITFTFLFPSVQSTAHLTLLKHCIILVSNKLIVLYFLSQSVVTLMLKIATNPNSECML